METILVALPFLFTRFYAFDQLSPIWGWKQFMRQASTICWQSSQLSINSPQSGDGNASTTVWLLVKNNHFRSTLPNLGMETLNRLPTSSKSQCHPFDQLSPIWGWKLPPIKAPEKLLNLTQPFDQLSPIWGWKPLALFLQELRLRHSVFRSTPPNLGMQTDSAPS